MSQIEVFYEGDFSTKCVHLESGSSIKTELANLSPTELFASSFGSCILTVMALAAEKMGLGFSGVKALVVKEMSRTLPRRIASLEVRVFCPLILTEPVRAQLEKVAKDCPIHHSLHPEIKASIQFFWGNP